jgi:RimJ/RimL family protein N-acetyltransferase
MSASSTLSFAPTTQAVLLSPVRFRRLRLPDDTAMIHAWFQHPHAKFWCLQGATVEQVREIYQAKLDDPHGDVHIGSIDGEPVVLVESYDPAHDQLAAHYAVEAGDVGMHICAAPARERVPGFTHHLFRATMDLMFDGLGARRVVVEPDVHNEKIHALNQAFGFVYQRNVVLKEKVASLGLCTRERYLSVIRKGENQ